MTGVVRQKTGRKQCGKPNYEYQEKNQSPISRFPSRGQESNQGSRVSASLVTAGRDLHDTWYIHDFHRLARALALASTPGANAVVRSLLTAFLVSLMHQEAASSHMRVM